MTAEDIKNVTFEKTMRGYRVEDVDDFLLQVAAEMERLQATMMAKEAERVEVKDNADEKMYVLAQKVEEYRGMEETLKTALINAQRMGETVVMEAKQKADSLIREASGKAELLRKAAEEETTRERETLEKLQVEVTRFKATVLNMYKQHIESLSALDAPAEEAADYLRNTFPPYTDASAAANGAEPVAPAAAAEPVSEGETVAAEQEPEMDAPVAQTPDNQSETVEAAVEVQQPQPRPETMSSVNLFEGVPLDTGD